MAGRSDFDGIENEITVEQIFLGDVNAADRAGRSVNKVPLAKPLDRVEEVYRALVIGTRDYVTKNGFRSVVIGLSGGIDSALTACIAVDALGPQAVTCVYMPTRYSSSESGRDAEDLARNLGTVYRVIPIEETFNEYLRMLATGIRRFTDWSC